jgi:hypothetical protein
MGSTEFAERSSDARKGGSSKHVYNAMQPNASKIIRTGVCMGWCGVQTRDGQSTVHVGQQSKMQEGGVAYRGKTCA